MEQWETNLEQTTFLRETLLAPLNRAVAQGLGARNADVCPGQGDWLFYGPAIDHLTGAPFLDRQGTGRDPVTALATFSDQLAARGIALIVMPVPVKASIYPEQFSPTYDGTTPVFNPSHGALIAALEARGVLVCDPSTALIAAKGDAPVYLARDSHWTPHGQHVAVAGLAAIIRENQLLRPQDATSYRAGEVEAVENRGDLVKLLYPEHSEYGMLESAEVRPVLGPDGEPWKPVRESPVLLLGDSFANIYGLASMGWGTGAGLAANLSLELQVHVDAITQNGDGAYATRLALKQELAQGRNRLEGKSVVVFAFSAREFSLGDWKPELQLDER